MSKLQELIDAANQVFLDNINLPEDKVVMLIIDTCSTDSDNPISISSAQNAYHALAVAAGIIDTPSQRKDKFLGLIEGLDLSTEEGYSEALSLSSEVKISGSSAIRYIRVVAIDNGIELYKRFSIAPWDDVVSQFTLEEVVESDKSVILERLKSIGYSDKAAGTAFGRLRKSLGYELPERMSTKLSNWFISETVAGNHVSSEDIKSAAIDVGMVGVSPSYYVGVFSLVTRINKKMKEVEQANT